MSFGPVDPKRLSLIGQNQGFIIREDDTMDRIFVFILLTYAEWLSS